MRRASSVSAGVLATVVSAGPPSPETTAGPASPPKRHHRARDWDADFASPIGAHMQRHLALECALGSAGRGGRDQLAGFARYLAVHAPTATTVRAMDVDRYLESLQHLHPGTRKNHLASVRRFARYMLTLDSTTHLPPPRQFPATIPAVLPYVYSEDEVAQLMQAARTQLPPTSLRPLTIETMIGCLWATGMRIGETCRLTLGDVDLAAGVLHIRETKFYKSRLVPLTPSTITALVLYAARRADAGYDQRPTAPFFVSYVGRQYAPVTVKAIFVTLTQQLGLFTALGANPRLHDFRHTFATRFLEARALAGDDPHTSLTVLATYLGHTYPSDTQVYLHPSSTLLAIAGEKLRASVVPSVYTDAQTGRRPSRRGRTAIGDDLLHQVQQFFQTYLVTHRGLSPHTIVAYRDALTLFFLFLVERTGRPATALTFTDCTVDAVLAFLDDLEHRRGNTITTRNLRLAVLRTFFRYLIPRDLAHAAQHQAIAAIPTKRTSTPMMDYLDVGEVQAILGAIDRSTAAGRRQYVLLTLLYNTGARVSEIVDLRVRHVRLGALPLATVTGKGRKTRAVPLWPETAALLQTYFQERAILDRPDAAPFVSQGGTPLTRFRVRYLVHTAVAAAGPGCPSLREKRISPHTWRHTTAMHLLQAGVDLIVIKSWLGHVDVKTTHAYVEADLEMKRNAIALCTPLGTPDAMQHVLAQHRDVLGWLKTV